MDGTQETLEKAYLTDVLERLANAIEAAERSLDESNDSLAKEHERLWEEGRHIVRDLDDAVELLAHNRVVDAHQRSYNIVQTEYLGLRSMLASPYFGRIDFQDREELLKVYIGRRAFIDSEALEFFVHDWRSPIASMFYDFDCGPSHYESPQGVIEGEMLLKRQYRIAHGIMEAMYDANALVKDDILGEILSRQAGHTLKVIAESIQKEQNQAIRFLAPRNMLVLGPAGSGKTSVGLHHIAYLLYHSRGRLSSQEIVAVSANHAFNEYIAGILPDLYEADIQRVVFADIIAPLVPGGLRIGGYFDQVEYLLTAREEDTRVRWIAQLYSTPFLTHIVSFVDEIPIKLMPIVFDDETIATKEAFEAFVRDGGVTTYRARLQRMDHYIQSQCEDYFARNANWIRQRVEESVARSEIDLYTEGEIVGHIDRLLSDVIARHKALLRRDNGLEERRMLAGAVSAYARRCNLPPALEHEFSQRMRRDSLFFEDMLALLCVAACMGRVRQQEGIRYVLVDEAQDYGVLQHFLLRAMYPRAVFTLLADTNQAVLPSIGIADARLFARMYPGDLTTFPLDKSYRSTGPIGALAAALIAHRQRMTYYEREGATPVLMKSENLEKAIVAIINKRPYDGTTAILAKTRSGALRLFAAIGARIGAGVLTETTDTISGQVNILPLYLSKGLEFDRVIAVLDGSGGGMEDAHNLLFLYCTRALHELYLLYDKELPSALSAGLAHLEHREFSD